MTPPRAKKSLGQHFLTDRSVLARIVAAAGITAGDRVLEIGPGRGALTRALVEAGARVTAVELDRELVPLLERQFAAGGQLEEVPADILRVDLRHLLAERSVGPWKLVANLPYNISSPLLFRFLEVRELFSCLVLMLQKEVGERLVAVPGTSAYGVLSLLLPLHFAIDRVCTVRPGSFFPRPQVDSLVLRFQPLPAPRTEVGNQELFRQVVKGAFGQRRKTLANALKGADLTADPGLLDRSLAEAGIDPRRRGETLSLEEFARLSRTLGGFLGDSL